MRSERECVRVCMEGRGAVIGGVGGGGGPELRCSRCEVRMQSSARGAAESLSAVLKVPLRSAPFGSDERRLREGGGGGGGGASRHEVHYQCLKEGR